MSYGWNLVTRIFFLPYNHTKIIFNMHTLKDIKNREHQLSSVYEQEFKKKLRTTIDFNSKITDFNEKLQAENSEYSEWEKESQWTYADIGNKISQLNASSIKVRSQLISE